VLGTPCALKVVQIHDMRLHQGWPALVLEYVEGPILEQHLASGPLPVREVDELVLGILRGVRAVHAQCTAI
jgi:hypothetical protein